MIKKQDILQMARSVFNRSNGITNRRVVHPHREWGIGITLFVIVVGVGGFLNSQSHSYYANLQDSVEVESISVTEFDTTAVDSAKAIFLERQQAFDALVAQDAVAPALSASSTPESATSTEAVADDDVDEAGDDVAGETPSDTADTAESAEDTVDEADESETSDETAVEESSTTTASGV